MEFIEMTQAISTVGFPIFVAVWYMVIGHKASQNHTESINKLANIIENNTKVIESLRK